MKKLLRYALIGSGALTIASAIVNIIAAWQLIESAEEQSLGITRNEIVGGYLVVFVIGAALIFFGVRVGRKK